MSKTSLQTEEAFIMEGYKHTHKYKNLMIKSSLALKISLIIFLLSSVAGKFSQIPL